MIRDATQDDLPRLRALQEAALEEPWPQLLALAVREGGPCALVSATSDGTPVGYALAVAGGPDDPGSREGADQAVAYIAEIAVAPAHRREGRASALLEAVADRFADRDAVRLTARADDESALAFYRANGFEAVSTIADHYQDETDGVLLGRRP